MRRRGLPGSDENKHTHKHRAQSKALHSPPRAAAQQPPEQQHIIARALMRQGSGSECTNPLSTPLCASVPCSSSECRASSTGCCAPQPPYTAQRWLPLPGALREMKSLRGEGEDECTALAPCKKTSAVEMTHSFHPKARIRSHPPLLCFPPPRPSSVQKHFTDHSPHLPASTALGGTRTCVLGTL